MQTKEGRTTIKAELGQLCRQAFKNVSHQSEEDPFFQRFLHFLQRILDPTQVRQWLKEAQSQTSTIDLTLSPPVAAIASVLAPVYEGVCDVLTQYASAEQDHTTSNLFLRKLVDSMVHSLRSFVHSNSHGSVLACCFSKARQKKLAAELVSQTLTSPEEYPAVSVAAVALEAAALMRIIVEKRLIAREPNDFDLFQDGIPPCLRIDPVTAISPESAVLILLRVVASLQAMNARIMTKYVEILLPTWLSLPSMAVLLGRLNAAAQYSPPRAAAVPPSAAPSIAAVASSVPSSSLLVHAAASSLPPVAIPTAQFSAHQRMVVFQSCLQLLCALVPQLVDESTLSGIPQQPLPKRVYTRPYRRRSEFPVKQPISSLSSSPLHLHFHSQPWVSRVREGEQQMLGVFGNQTKYMRMYMPAVKLRLLELMHTLAVQTSSTTGETSVSPLVASSASSESSFASSHATAVIIASCFWRDLECDVEVPAVNQYIKLLASVLPAPPAGRFHASPSVEERTARGELDRLIETSTCIDVEDLLVMTQRSGESSSRLICLVMQNALLRWPNMDETLIRSMQEFVLKQLPLLIETKSVDKQPAEFPNVATDASDASATACKAEHASIPSLSALFESDSLHLCDNILQDGLYTVFRRFEQYFPEYAPMSIQSRRSATAQREETKADETASELASVEQSEHVAERNSSLPTWLPTVSLSYAGVDDLDPVARQYRGFGTSTNDGDFHPSQAAAREHDPYRLLSASLKSTMRTMKVHSQFLLDQTRDHVRRLHRCERMLDSSRQIDPALKAELREERCEMKQRVKLKGKGCDLPPIIAEAIQRQQDRALHEQQRKMSVGEEEEDDIEMKDCESTAEAGKSSTERESSISPLPTSHSARFVPSSRSMVPGDPLSSSILLLPDFSLTTFISSLLIDLIIPRGEQDCAVFEEDEVILDDELKQTGGIEKDRVELQGSSTLVFNPRWHALLLLYPDSERPEQPSLHSARDLTSTLLRVIDACMEAVSGEARLLECLLTCQLTPAATPPSASAAPGKLDGLHFLFLSALSAMQTMHCSLVLLTDLHALHPEDTEAAWNRMVVDLEATCVAMEQLIRQQEVTQHEHDATSEKFLDQLTCTRTLLSPYHTTALENLKEKRAEMKRKRVRQVQLAEGTANHTERTESSGSRVGKRRRTHSAAAVRGGHSSSSYIHSILDAFSTRDAELSDDPENDQEDFRELEEFLAYDPCSICQKEAEVDDGEETVSMQCCRTCHKPVCLECAPLIPNGKKFRCRTCQLRKHQQPA